MLRCALWLTALAGCELVFVPGGSNEPPPPPDADTRCDGGTIGSWTSDFEDGTPAWAQLYEVANDMIEIVDGEVHIAPINTLVVTYAGMQSQARSAFRDRTVRVRIDQMLAVDKEAQAALSLFAPVADTYAQITQVEGELYFEVVIGGTPIRSQTSWDPVLHAWWQLRETAGVLYFETSSGGTAFTMHTSLPTPPFLDDVELDLNAGTYTKTIGPLGEVHFDDLIECTP